MTLIVDTAVKLRKNGHKVVIVSSGAIGVGLRRMDIDKRPKHLAQLQACHVPEISIPRIPSHIGLQALAAIGQCRLISLWDSLFGHLSQPVAQVLLTRNDIADVRADRLRGRPAGVLMHDSSERDTSMHKTPSTSSWKRASSPLSTKTTPWPFPRSSLETTIPFQRSQQP